MIISFSDKGMLVKTSTQEYLGMIPKKLVSACRHYLFEVRPPPVALPVNPKPTSKPSLIVLRCRR